MKRKIRKSRFLFFILLIFIPLKDAFSEDYNKKAMQQYVEGMSFLEKGKTDKAVECLEKAIKSEPAFYMAYYQLGEIYIDKKDFEKAEHVLKKVVEINPNFLPVHRQHLRLGELYLEIKQNDSAINSFEKVIELDPNNFGAHYNLGQLYAEIGEINCAKKEFENAASIVPDNEIVLKYLDDINKRLEPQKEKVDNFDNASDTVRQQSSFQPQASQQIPEKRFTTTNYKLIVGISITFVCIVIFLPFLIDMRSQARRDYKLSRGTQHLKQIRISIDVLNIKIQRFTNKISKLKSDIKELEDERYDKLYRALTSYLLKTRLREVEGIGPKLREAIINEYSHGTLDSLRYACERINGIGQQKQREISKWINVLKYQIPELLKQDFTGKDVINKEYESKTKDYKAQFSKIAETLNSMGEIRKKLFLKKIN